MKKALCAALLALSTTAATAQEPLSFCQRMAAELPMKEKKVAGTVRAFDMQTLSSVQRWLVGGSSYWTLKAEPIDDTPEERERIENMCSTVPCSLEGPLLLTLGLKDGTLHQFEAKPGERMRLESVGTRIRCADLAPV